MVGKKALPANFEVVDYDGYDLYRCELDTFNTFQLDKATEHAATHGEPEEEEDAT